MKTKNKLNFFEELTEKHRLENNINDFLTDEEREQITEFDELAEILENKDFFYIEVIYYKRAMEILSEYDNSLGNSLQLAKEMGFTIDNINSELLASLLLSEMEREIFYQIEEEINEFFND